MIGKFLCRLGFHKWDSFERVKTKKGSFFDYLDVPSRDNRHRMCMRCYLAQRLCYINRRQEWVTQQED